MAQPQRPLIDYRPTEISPDAIMDGFLSAMIDRDLELYPAQEEAILELLGDRHVVLNTPTGSGKSMVALALHFKALTEGKRVFYTSPIKALVSEKFFALCEDLGPENVGMMTGDASINKSAPIQCCTAEILANIALRDAEDAPVDYVIMDEFHYYGDSERGVAWQTPLLMLPHVRFLLMSATLGNMDTIMERLEAKTGVEVALVATAERPVPLDFSYALEPIHETLEVLLSSNRAPIYVVNFTQRACAELASALMSVNFTSKEKKAEIKAALGGFRFDTAYGKDIRRYLMHGLGLHHAGLLPKYRLLTEQLAQQGLLKVVCGTDTLGVGVNIPIRSVLFAKLCKFDGTKTGVLSVRDFKQISGRAGRKGFDDAGSVVAQAPEHVIENLRLEAKARGADGKKKKKVNRKQPPTRGYVHFDEKTFERLQTSEPESLSSQFSISHGTILNLAQGHSDGYARLQKLIDDCHDDDEKKEAHRKRADELIAALEDAGLLKREEAEGRVALAMREDLQLDFSLNQTLSLYLIEALVAMESQRENEPAAYALDVATLAEAILENPNVILRAQVSKKKGEKIQELKAEGMEYDDRMEQLEKIEHDKPNEDFIYTTFNLFRDKHPWVGAENIKPKSIVREMFERYLSFHEYIKEYGLSRSEGILLRHVSQAYRVLAQTVPETARNDELLDVIAYLRTMLVNVDSSLITEWESMRAGAGPQAEEDPDQKPPIDIRRDKKAFLAHLRAELHALASALSRGEYDEAQGVLLNHEEWDEAAFKTALVPFFEVHERIVFDYRSRFVDKTIAKKREDSDVWDVRQVLTDELGDDDFALEGEVDLGSWRPDTPLFRLKRIAD